MVVTRQSHRTPERAAAVDLAAPARPAPSAKRGGAIERSSYGPTPASLTGHEVSEMAAGRNWYGIVGALNGTPVYYS